MRVNLEIRVPPPSQQFLKNSADSNSSTTPGKITHTMPENNSRRGMTHDPDEPRLSKQQQRELIRVCEEWIEYGHELKNKDFAAGLADALLERDWDKEMKGSEFVNRCYPTWGSLFLKGQPMLRRKFTEAKKAANANEDDLAQKWVLKLKSSINKHDIEMKNIYVVKEVAYLTAKTKRSKAVTLTRPAVPDDERRPVASAIYCFSGEGKMLSPWAMFKGTADSSCDTSAQIKLTYNENGFPSRFDFMRWLVNHFDPQTRSSLEVNQWRLMIVDAYECPIKEDFFFWCREHKILCMTFPRKKREDLDPFCWGVLRSIEHDYRKLIQSRWNQHLARTSREAHTADRALILKAQEFVDILGKITTMGTATELAARKIEAANAWSSVLCESLRAQTRISEDREPWNQENVDEILANIDEGDFGPRVVASPGLSSEGEAEPTPCNSDDSSDSSDSDDSDDSDEDNEDYDDNSYAASPREERGRSRVSTAIPTTARVTRSQSRARSMASENRARSPRSPDRHFDAFRASSALPSRSRSRPPTRPPSTPHARRRAARPSPNRRVPSERKRLLSESDGLLSPVPSSSLAETASPAFSNKPDQFSDPKLSKKRTIGDVMEDHARSLKLLKHMPENVRVNCEKHLDNAVGAEIVSILNSKQAQLSDDQPFNSPL